MKTIRYTLLSDGSSDRMLMTIIEWLLSQHCQEIAIESSWADLARLRQPPKILTERIKVAVELYPCDLLFVHRDAEKESYEFRHAEINSNLAGIDAPPAICVIPVRMMEAWFLLNELAIRRAAGNPHGRNSLKLPNANVLENIPDPYSGSRNMQFKIYGGYCELLKTSPPVKRSDWIRLAPSRITRP